MAGRGRASFKKRQKEQIRLERRQEKAARKEERKAAKQALPPGHEQPIEPFEDFQPPPPDQAPDQP